MDLVTFDTNFYTKYKINFLVGIDEVGRGCFAGPMYVCGYLLNTLEKHIINGVNDSKKVTIKNRIAIANQVNQSEYKIVSSNNECIDEFGIAKCIEDSIEEIIKFYSQTLDSVHFLIDGKFKNQFGTNTTQIIAGDSKSYVIALASIIAKVERDKYMVEISNQFPEYSFQQNKGYGTQKHIQAISEFGACKLHRNSFIKSYV